MADKALPGVEHVDLARLDAAGKEALVKALAKFLVTEIQEDLRKRQQRKLRE